MCYAERDTGLTPYTPLHKSGPTQVLTRELGASCALIHSGLSRNGMQSEAECCCEEKQLNSTA